MNIAEARDIMGAHMIGPEEFTRIANRFSVSVPSEIAPIPFEKKLLEDRRDTHILIWGPATDSAGNPLTINRCREMFGCDPAVSEPCMYNQDWYLKEKFASETTLENKWYVIAKSVREETRAVAPDEIQKALSPVEQFPSAILTAVTFFAQYFLSGGELLWKHDFLWCSDTDSNGDRIYTGRYEDPKGVNKNGFNIHRHLSLKTTHASAAVIVS